MSSSPKAILAVLMLVAATLLLVGCPPSTKISDIEKDPGKYANKDVTIGGRVSTSYGALGTGMFQLDDGSGTMWVYSQNYGVPGNGSKVAVTGRISQGFSFGGRSFAIILRQTQPRH
ncbi:MAG TPA: OB-fold nucleic acid binding domain-containing protein [Terriglobales bacterium]|nr:OB-fold nucleic acid binding domain-containing protein [Terriglobales bacterium]